jgi:hypothetical protein
MEYRVQNVTMLIGSIINADMAGDCICYIPFSHKRFFAESCSMLKNKEFTADGHEPIFFHNYGEIHLDKDQGHYYTSSADLLIAYLGWLLTEDGPQTIKVEYSEPFWAIHDAQHAIHDESGCTIYVDSDTELMRLHEAFKLMIANGHLPTYELIEEVNQAYNERFGKNVDFAEDYLYPYLEQEEEEEEEEAEVY